MSRIPTLDADSATGETRQLLDAVQVQLGAIPNFIRVLAQSPAALKAFLGLYQIAGDGQLDSQTRERIALAIAQENGCEYCVSAHTAIAQKAGLSADEIRVNRSGSSQLAEAAAGVVFAKRLMEDLGDVSDADIHAVRSAGYNDAQLVEIIVHVALNALTNILGKAAQIDIDFPRVSLNELAK